MFVCLFSWLDLNQFSISTFDDRTFVPKASEERGEELIVSTTVFEFRNLSSIMKQFLDVMDDGEDSKQRTTTLELAGLAINT